MSHEAKFHSLFQKDLDKLRKKKKAEATKVDSYIRSLRKLGLNILQTNKAKRLSGDGAGLFELRPFPNRVLFCTNDKDSNGFLILHMFEKKYNGAVKPHEIATAKARLDNWKAKQSLKSKKQDSRPTKQKPKPTKEELKDD